MGSDWPGVCMWKLPSISRTDHRIIETLQDKINRITPDGHRILCKEYDNLRITGNLNRHLSRSTVIEILTINHHHMGTGIRRNIPRIIVRS